MLGASEIERLICLVSSFTRQELIRQFRSYPASFPLDFTEDFLDSVSEERLRHIFVAVCLQTQKLPVVESAELAA